MQTDLKSMTVLQLRKIAKDNGIVLGAGIDKAGIIQKILLTLSSETVSDPAPVVNPENEVPGEPKFQAAWHNVDAPRYNTRPAYQAPAAPLLPVILLFGSNLVFSRFGPGLPHPVLVRHPSLLLLQNQITPLVCNPSLFISRLLLPCPIGVSVNLPGILTGAPFHILLHSLRLPSIQNLFLCLVSQLSLQREHPPWKSCLLPETVRKAEAFWNCILMGMVS